ncbi:MAG: hypothetical protein JNM99_09485 [Verrucomicrobiaceae bacterium]|nr:hypothetical protein [Verrucomicrobiaceae bacterium]
MKGNALEAAKAALPIASLWARLGLPGRPPARDGLLVSCPFPDRHKNGDRKPSFNAYGGGQRFKCFGCGIEGGAPDFIALTLGLDEKSACLRLVEMAGGCSSTSSSSLAFSSPPSVTVECRARVELPALDRGKSLARLRLMKSRSVSFGAVDLAVRHGSLGFGSVCGAACWVLGDASRRAVEARRLDRSPFPALGKLGERKAHSLKGSDKSWPVGVELLRALPTMRAVMLVEGGPDFLAALHFIYKHEVGDVWPCAMLGRTTGGKIHPEALELLAGRKVRIYAHADEDGGGVVAAGRWAAQLMAAGCSVDGFSFAGLVRADGLPVKDLNDCCLMTEADQLALNERGLLP